ncbi:hypothetical protein JTE90_019123 [Oedothorax gibbosus]|uniref:Uncharacterized protein n=1 Tax=Oedothorax gibbosus TaxID=931172 RepID=A0AAV6V869_9ARAC|nr:hypothetical protein JTE90_019123 [Oedothorax gibbosus]
MSGTCNQPLGLGSGSIPDSSITTSSGSPFQGRLQSTAGSWCADRGSIEAGGAVLTVDLKGTKFVGGIASQGPPEKLHGKEYSHLVAYLAAYGDDGKVWTEFNGGALIFDMDRNDTSDAVNFYVSDVIVPARYVRINVTMQVSGSPTVCLRFEFYGCDTDVTPATSLRALTTAQGQIEVTWDQPSAVTTLDSNVPSSSFFRPVTYSVLYRPMDAERFASSKADASRTTLELKDVRLGAEYELKLRCQWKDLEVNCGELKVEAYPPCPETWTGGNEFHCFLYFDHLSSFEDAKDSCLANDDVKHTLGDPSYLVDDAERKFLASRIIPADITEMWFVGGDCKGKGDCCKILRKDEEDILRESICREEDILSAVCVRDHKGEGSKIRVSSVKASESGSSVHVSWRYDGKGWKTDKLQARVWTESDVSMATYMFSTLEESFMLEGLDPGTMYSMTLRPAPNIRTEEFEYKFVNIDFGANLYGALLTPIPMSVYVIWSGTLLVTWTQAEAFSISGTVKQCSKYSVSHETIGVATLKKEIVENKHEFKLTPLTMEAQYVFRLGCLFADVYYPCGMANVTTDPPHYIRSEGQALHTLYEVINSSKKTWFEAEGDCQKRDGHLTSILDESEGKALLGILPAKDAKLWSGAKLKRNGTSFWTDGNKITYLPMAKNSGVLPNQDSCCRALNEAGRLRVEGGQCSDLLPHLCKYSVTDILSPPKSLIAKIQTWNSLSIAWQRPVEGWLPTSYDVSICEKKDPAKCPIKKYLENQWDLLAENLKEFTAYNVGVRAALTPIKVEAEANKSIYTYPRQPVRIVISPSGEMTLETPMLVAMGREGATVAATLHKEGAEVAAAVGDTSHVLLSGIVPEEKYRLVVEEKMEGKTGWTYESQIDAVPSCLKITDRIIGLWCSRMNDSKLNFGGASTNCKSMVQTSDATIAPEGLYKADTLTVLADLATSLALQEDFWVDQPAAGVSKTSDDECSISSGDKECCRYVIAKKIIVCSYCCEIKRPSLCAYKVKAKLGKVSNLLPSFIGNDSIGVSWTNPDDAKWVIHRYEVQWRSNEVQSVGTSTKNLEGSRELLMEGLEFGTEYEITVTPLGMNSLKGDEAKLLVTTLEPRPPLSITVQTDGVTVIRAPLLSQRGRGQESVRVSLSAVSPARTILEGAQGKADGVELTGLDPGAEYRVEMTPLEEGGKKFNYSRTFKAFPSCEAHHIQEGLLCVWAGEGAITRQKAADACKADKGQLLDFGAQHALAPENRARLAALVQGRFWVDLSSAEFASLVDEKECSGEAESDVMCCTYEATPGGELNDLKCTCCQDPRPFACKRENKINLGDIGDIVVEDVTPTSLKLEWTLDLNCKWKKPSFLVTWDDLSANQKRQKRSAANQIVVKDAETTISKLQPGTSYQVAVAPYSDETQVGDVVAAGFTESRCTSTILKIACCVSVIIGSSITVFVFIATRMFDLDCVAQILMELSLLGAYVCILVSSAQTYSEDSACGRANPTLCVAVAALLQFFFQSAFLFILMESLIVCSTLKDYLPEYCTPRSPTTLVILGFGIPGIINIIIAAIESDEYTDKKENCWLYLYGRAVLPSVVPVLVFSIFTLLFLLSVFDADEPREDGPKSLVHRGSVFLKTRWSCFVVFAFTVVCYSTGLFGANNNDPTLTYVFAGFSISLGTLLPIVRIRWDDQVREQLKRGLFASLRDDIGGIRVTPAPGHQDSRSLLKMAEFSSAKFGKREQQFASTEFHNKEDINHRDIVAHR